MSLIVIHDDVIKWKTFPRYWPFVWGIHRSPVNSLHKGQWRGGLGVFFDLRLNKRLSKQSWGWRLETLSRSLWRHCNVQLHYCPIVVEATLKYRDKVSRESCPYYSLDVLPLRPPELYGEINHVYWKGIGNKQHSDKAIPDSKVHGANMGTTWVLSAPDGPHVCPMNLAIRGSWKYVNMPWDILYVSAKTYEMG